MKHRIFHLSCMLFLFCATYAAAQESPIDVNQKLTSLGISLPEKSNKSDISIVGAVRSGNLIYLSGHGPDKADGTQVVGKIGKDLSVEEGREAARLAGIALLRTLKAEIGDLNKVKKVIKVLGMVNAVPEFTQQPQVMNGFSDLIVQIFGKEKGQHARSAVGVGSLPNGIAVEIEMIVELKD